jgi:hypothetical protein
MKEKREDSKTKGTENKNRNVQKDLRVPLLLRLASISVPPMAFPLNKYVQSSFLHAQCLTHH